MDAYTNGHGHGNGKGNGRYSPFLITGHDLAALSDGDGVVQGAVAAALVRGEANLVWPTVPQAGMVTVCPLHRVYEGLRWTPKARGLLIKDSVNLVGAPAFPSGGNTHALDTTRAGNGNGTMSLRELDAYVGANLLAVWDSIERVTA